MNRFLAAVRKVYRWVAGPDPVREAKLILRDVRRFHFDRRGFQGCYAGSVGPLRLVLDTRNAGGSNPIVHPANLWILFGPWRKLRVRVGRYAVFTLLPSGRYGYLKVWRFKSLPQEIRDGLAHDWVTRRDLDLFPMALRVRMADLPIPHYPCAECGESTSHFDLESFPGDEARYCWECFQKLEEEAEWEAAQRERDWEDGRTGGRGMSYDEQEEWDDRVSAQIDNWGDVYA